MIDPSKILDVIKIGASLAQGAYRAGAGVPKYELYKAFQAAAPNQGKPHKPSEEQFIDFLMKARICMSKEDYEKIVLPNIVYMYAGSAAKDFINKSGDTSELFLNIEYYKGVVEQRYGDFSEAYEKLSSKGYPTKAAGIRNNISNETPEQKDQKPARVPEQVNVATYRKNVVDFFSSNSSPQHDKKKSEAEENDKEINIDQKAKTNEIDTQPITCKFNNQTIYINPRPVARRMYLQGELKNKSKAAVNSTPKEKSTLTEAQVKKINTGMSEHIARKKKHGNDAFLTQSLSGIKKIGYPGTHPRNLQFPPEAAAHILAIMVIASESDLSNPKIQSNMSISRIVAIGQVNAVFSVNASDRVALLSSKESVIALIRSKVAAPESEKLIQTLELVCKQNPTITIGAAFQAYVTNVLHYSDSSTKQPIEGVIEFCEADATAKEHIAQTDEVLVAITPYLRQECDKANQNSENSSEMQNQLSILQNNVNRIGNVQNANPVSPDAPEATSSKRRDSSESDDESDDADDFDMVSETEQTTPLNMFAKQLEDRVDNKVSSSHSALKKAKNLVKFKETVSKIQVQDITHHLGIAATLINDDLSHVLAQGPHSHKTKEGDRANKLREAEIIGYRQNIEELNSHVIKLEVKINKLSKDESEIDEKISKLESSASEKEKQIEKNILQINLIESRLTDDNASKKQEKKQSLNQPTVSFSQQDLDEMDRLRKENAKLNAEIKEAKTEIETSKATRHEIKDNLEAALKEREAIAERISDILHEINQVEMDCEAYEQECYLENPEDIVERVCDEMNEARKHNPSTLELDESKNETSHQNELFNQFYNALKNTPPEGEKLAEHMKKYVENKINANVKKENQIVIVSGPTMAKKQSPGIAPSSSSSSKVAEPRFKPEIHIPLTEQAYHDYTPNKDLVGERAALIAEVSFMLAEKRQDNGKYREKHGVDNPKIVQLENALNYLRGEHEFYDPKKHSVEQKYSNAAVSAPTDDKVKRSFLASKFQKATSGNLGSDDTPLLLDKVQKHQEAVKEAHEQSNKKDMKTTRTNK